VDNAIRTGVYCPYQPDPRIPAATAIAAATTASARTAQRTASTFCLSTIFGPRDGRTDIRSMGAAWVPQFLRATETTRNG
jgi:hypothetical protein